MREMTRGYFERYLAVDPETGNLIWKPRIVGRDGNKRTVNAWNARFAGKQAFTAKTDRGYFWGAVNGKQLAAHRVCACLYFGVWPQGDVDHINGDTADNRKSNLRVVSKSENQRNQKLSKASTTGFGGVSFYKKTGRYRAQVKVAGRSIHLGEFDTAEEAAAARRAFNAENAFTARHGVAQ